MRRWNKKLGEFLPREVSGRKTAYLFFYVHSMWIPGIPSIQPKLEKTSKLANPTLLVWETESRRPQGGVTSKLEKTSKLLIFIQRLKACLFMGNILY